MTAMAQDRRGLTLSNKLTSGRACPMSGRDARGPEDHEASLERRAPGALSLSFDLDLDQVRLAGPEVSQGAPSTMTRLPMEL
jgi:hypothetical protein